jgi:hypothetical protein
MRKILLLFICLLGSTTLWAQGSKKDISLEDIWKKGSFRMKSVPGFNAMKDGSITLHIPTQSLSNFANTTDRSLNETRHKSSFQK